MTYNEFDENIPKLLGTIQEDEVLEPRVLFHRLIDQCNLSRIDAHEALGRLHDSGYLLANKKNRYELTPLGVAAKR